MEQRQQRSLRPTPLRPRPRKPSSGWSVSLKNSPASPKGSCLRQLGDKLQLLALHRPPAMHIVEHVVERLLIDGGITCDCEHCVLQ